MMELRVICALLLFAGCSLAQEEDDHGSNALSYTADNFAAEVDKKPHFVMFFAPWCGHCKRLAPTWDELAKKHNSDPEKSDFLVAKVDCTQETGLCSEHGVTGYPTVKLFKDGSKESEKYKGPRTIENFEEWIKMKMNPEPEDDEQKEELAAAPSADGLVVLGSDNFDTHTQTGMHFIKFYAPWCGHCQRLAPTWDDLAKKFASDDSVSIAKVDCTAHDDVCKKLQIRGYPTLHFFKNGEKVDSYRGSRDLDSLEAFVNRKKAEGDGADDSEADKVPDIQGKPADFVPGKVMDLTSETFNSGIREGTVFVKFFAPWCGHCKRLAPTWDELAQKLENAKNTRIAKVDCTQERELCSTQQVNGFPTLKIFKNGKFSGEHNGPRDIDSLYQAVAGDKPHDEL